MNFKNQKQLFEYIWDERPHISELSGKPLLPKENYRWHWQFLHVLPKGVYTKFRLNPENIMLALPEEHEHQERFQKFIERRDELRKIYREMFETNY